MAQRDAADEAIHTINGTHWLALLVNDDCCRENLALIADTSMAGERVTRKLDALVRISGKPDCIISDSGTEFTSKARPGSPTRSCSWRLPWC